MLKEFKKLIIIFSVFTFSFGIFNESFEDIDEVSTIERITTNTNDGGLTQTSLGGLVDGFVGQSTRSGDDTYGNEMENKLMNKYIV